MVVVTITSKLFYLVTKNKVVKRLVLVPKKEKCKFSYQKWQNFEDDECCGNSDVSVESDGANDGQEDEEDAAEAEAQLALDEESLPA